MVLELRSGTLLQASPAPKVGCSGVCAKMTELVYGSSIGVSLSSGNRPLEYVCGPGQHPTWHAADTTKPRRAPHLHLGFRGFGPWRVRVQSRSSDGDVAFSTGGYVYLDTRISTMHACGTPRHIGAASPARAGLVSRAQRKAPLCAAAPRESPACACTGRLPARRSAWLQP